MTKWPTVRAGDVLKLVRRAVELEPTSSYTEVGVRSFGRGLFHKPPVTGLELGTKRVFEIGPGELVINIVFAWEGAVALSGAADVGTIGSHRFLTYQGDPDRVDVDFVRAYLVSEAGREALTAASPGSAGRNRTLSQSGFEELIIPLPPLDEQRRIAQRLGAVEDGVSKLAGSWSLDGAAAVDSAVEQFLGRLPEQAWTWRRINQVADVNPRRARLSEDDLVTFVPMAAVDEFTGSILRPEVRTAAAVGKGYTQFLPGDVIFARITPCMQNGKSALFLPSANVRAGYGSTEFHVLRPTGVDGEWLHAWLRRRRFRLQATEAFTGTAGQQRVPAGYLAETEILVPPTPRAQEAATERMREFERLRQALVERQRTRSALRDAVGPALLNEVFSGRP